MKDLTNKRFYKDKLHKKITGVCAGLAGVFEIDRWIVRIMAIVCFVTFPVITGMAYLLASALLPDRYSNL